MHGGGPAAGRDGGVQGDGERGECGGQSGGGRGDLPVTVAGADLGGGPPAGKGRDRRERRRGGVCIGGESCSVRGRWPE